MRSIIVIFFSFFLVEQGFAQVWQHDTTRSWDDSWRQRYQRWIESDLQGNTIKQWGSPFARLKLDCADAHYALLAYFARENQLPFSVDKGRVTNMTTRFNHIRNMDDRLAAFMDYLRAHYGTEALSHRDTFPPAIHDIKPGDLFMWKIPGPTRHTYLVKSINKDGTLNVLYSTQANAAKRGPLKAKNNFTPPYHPTNGGGDRNFWGFRRFKFPQHIDWDQEDVPGASFEQYDWARSMSHFQFWQKVQDTLRTEADDPNKTLTIMYESLCKTVQERVDIVEEALRFASSIGNRCMNYNEYDAHSTPGRDTGIKGQYESLFLKLNQYSSSGKLSLIDGEILDIVEAIYDDSLPSSDQQILYNYCPVKFGPGSQDKVDLNTFRMALFAGEVSYHPNDNLFWRWGLPQGNKTRCKEHYGYPED